MHKRDCRNSRGIDAAPVRRWPHHRSSRTVVNWLAPRAPGLVPEGTNFPTPTGVAKGLSEPMGGIFCGPLRLLALEVYEDMNARGVYCSLLTGQERKEVPFADHVSCTIEMVNINRAYDVAVIDEIQMIGSPQRGHAWTRALLG